MKTINQLAQKYNVDIEKAKDLLGKKGIDISDIDAPLDFESEMLAEEILGVQQRFAQMEKGLQPGKQIETRVYPTYETKKDGLMGCGMFGAVFVVGMLAVVISFFSSMYGKAKSEELKEPESSSLSQITDSSVSSPSSQSQSGLQSITESELPDENKTVTFTWYDENSAMQWQYTDEYPNALYDEYKAELLPENTDYSQFVTDSRGIEYLNAIVEEFSAQHKNNPDAAKLTEQMLITFVQGMDYYRNDEKQRPKYPFETLYDSNGDDEDMSVLLMALLKLNSSDVVLLKFEEHTAIGIAGDYEGICYEHNGVNYYYLETVAGTWSIGDAPEQYVELTPEIIVCNFVEE